MDGLSKILTKINEDSSLECSRITERAAAKAEEILSDAKVQGNAISDKMIAQAKAKALLIDAKAKSGAELEYKRDILKEKTLVISDMITASSEYLCSLDDETYFSYIERLVLANALTGDGVMFFSERDAKRIPNGFIDSLNQKLGQNKNIKLSDKYIDTKGGFVLSYTEMRVDCTFESLIDDISDDIKDELSRILFA